MVDNADERKEGRRMRDQSKPVRKVISKLRKMNYWQRILVMDWLKDWYRFEMERSEDE